MKLRTIALAGVAALALTGPAAAGQGWYLGLGVGWDNMGQVKTQFTGAPDLKSDTDASALFVGTLGYKFTNNLRAEFEFGYDRHDVSDTGVDGHAGKCGKLINILYDAPLGDRWMLTVGAGAGVGTGDVRIDDAGTPFTYAVGHKEGFMWQGIAGISYAVDPNLDIFVDYRYRSLSLNKSFDTSFTAFAPAKVRDLNEQAAVVGIRWYPWVAEAPPPPMPPPPPPMAPPAVKTFIVFFDFNKSNLTAEAQSVVTQAVATAKSTGAVRVMVTGHTDTVGSDSYNMALSVRRAQSVKDSMMQQGMDGSGISIEGKGFHDPLVPTGPGVREPQNRRAVIDLGG